ncbi:sigma-70 family RNA polymerase sigma factor, partial [Pararhodobacter marinus]|uniref:sigma-70 family RNA polymerase sigma factor n=1 Tax=Pararhodobacter marinus TaxID=2184063 RepID=UPI003516B32D
DPGGQVRLTALNERRREMISIIDWRMAQCAARDVEFRFNTWAEAEDVTQEAMLRLWQIAPDWQPGGAKPSTWLHRVAANLATDRLRKRRGVALDSIPEPDDPSPGAAEGMIEADRRIALDTALGQLPDRQRVAVVLRHLEGLTNPEIGAAMGIGVEAVESLIARGKRRLAQLLAGRRDELGYER